MENETGKDRFGLNVAFVRFTDDGTEYGKRHDDVLKVIEVRPSPKANLTGSTIATGETIYDSKVIMPTDIVCKCSLEIDGEGKWRSALDDISKAYNRNVYFANRTNMAMVQSKTSVYKYLALSSCPHVESPEFGDMFYFDLRFSQMIFISNGDIVSPDSASDSDVVYIGNV